MEKIETFWLKWISLIVFVSGLCLFVLVLVSNQLFFLFLGLFLSWDRFLWFCVLFFSSLEVVSVWVFLFSFFFSWF